MEPVVIITLIGGSIYFVYLVVYLLVSSKQKKEAAKLIHKIIDEYGLTFSNMITYYCKYVGGHPERNKETSSYSSILFGTKNGKLIFFEGNIRFDDSKNQEGRTSHKELKVDDKKEKLTHLFDIPINSIVDVRYFDSTTSVTAGYVLGDYFALPINMKKGDASVFIDWSDGKYNHSTEFRFAGLMQGRRANERANSLRNTFVRMTK